MSISHLSWINSKKKHPYVYAIQLGTCCSRHDDSRCETVMPNVENTLGLLQLNFSLNSTIKKEPYPQFKYETSCNKRGHYERLYKSRC